MRLTTGLLLLLTFAIAHAEPAFERGADDTIKLRGQGINPWSFAFAEARLLNIPDASVFDLAKAHAAADAAMISALLDKDGKAIGGAKLLFTGSPSLLATGVDSVRATKCTLEQPLLRMNRSFALNPYRVGLYDQLAEFHKKTKAKGEVFDIDQRDEIKSLQIQALIGILQTLAAGENTADAFVTKVIEFTSCADSVQIPKVELEAKILTNESAIRAELTELLKNKKAVILGVCSEILEDAKNAATCSAHLIVAKEMKANKVLVLDSGFFTPGKKAADGSQLANLETLVKASAKFGAQIERDNREGAGKRAQREFEATAARLKKEMDESMAALSAQGGNLGDAMKETIAGLRKSLARVAPAKFKEAVIAQLSKVEEGEEDDVDEDMIAEIEKLDLKTPADLVKLEPVLLASLKRNAEKSAEQLRQNGSGEFHYAWPLLEPGYNFVREK